MHGLHHPNLQAFRPLRSSYLHVIFLPPTDGVPTLTLTLTVTLKNVIHLTLRACPQQSPHSYAPPPEPALSPVPNPSGTQPLAHHWPYSWS